MDIVFDFDGTLCKYDGWKGHNNIGKPIPGMIKLVKTLLDEGHTLKLCTTRLNPCCTSPGYEDPLVVCGAAREYIERWLRLQGILHCFKEITGYKPYGDVYIDDRAVRYDPVALDCATVQEIKDYLGLE